MKIRKGEVLVRGAEKTVQPYVQLGKYFIYITAGERTILVTDQLITLSIAFQPFEICYMGKKWPWEKKLDQEQFCLLRKTLSGLGEYIWPSPERIFWVRIRKNGEKRFEKCLNALFFQESIIARVKKFARRKSREN